MDQERTLQRILLIDDNPDDRLLAIRELEREFPQVQFIETSNVVDFKQSLGTSQPDLIITDYELNWSTGLEILRLVKDYDSTMPVIMFTNSGTQEIAVAAMKAGLDDYVLKSPRHFIRLSQAVRTVWKNAQTRRRVAQLELQLQFLLNQLDIGVFRSTLTGQLLDVNKGFLQVLRLSSPAEIQSFFQRYLFAGEIDRSSQEQREREVQIPNPNAEPIWLQIKETLIHVNNEDLIDGLVIDITAKKQAETTILQMNQLLERRIQERTDQLAALNRELETFAFSVSHDLQAPVRQIDGFVGFLRQQLEPITDETVEHYLEVISVLANDAGRLIEDLLQFSRMGRTEMQFVSVDMNRLVQETIHQLEAQTQGRNIVWHIQSLPLVEGDQNLLRQVWRNLIENAVKYTRPRSTADISIGSISSKSERVFFVQDNGVGFDSHYHDRLFNIFQRLHSDREFEGTGIGLANVQRIIHRHGGRVWAEGAINAGATFYFSLPQAHPDTVE